MVQLPARARVAAKTCLHEPTISPVQEMERHETDLRALRGLFAVGTLLAGMGILNAFNTIQTIVAKKRTSAAQRQRAKAQ